MSKKQKEGATANALRQMVGGGGGGGNEEMRREWNFQNPIKLYRIW